MKKKVSVVMLITIFVVSAFSSTAYAQVSQPLAAAGGTLDFYITPDMGLDIDYCNEYIIAYANVYSPSNSTPDVIAEVNGVNQTMSAPLFLLSGGLNDKYFAAGITYYAYIENPRIGEYNLTIHAGNSSGYYKSSMSTIQYNKTYEIKNLWANGSSDVEQINCFKYLFSLYEFISSYECVSSAIVTINGTVYTMLQNLPSSYYYIHDFGTPTVDSTYVVNFTINTGTGSYFVEGGELVLEAPTSNSKFDYDMVEAVYSETGIQYTFMPSYYDGLNRPLQGLIVSLNGTNTTLPTAPLMEEEFYGTFITGYQEEALYCKSYLGVDYIAYSEAMNAWVDGGMVGPQPQSSQFITNMPTEDLNLIDFTLNYDTYYNISIWWSNGTWYEINMINDYIIDKVYNIAAPTVTFTAPEVAIVNRSMYVTANITVTSPVENFRLEDNDYFSVSIWAPERGNGNAWAYEVNNTDNNFTDGKVYSLNYTLWSDSREYWGDVLLNATIQYGNDSESTQADFNLMYATQSITRKAGAEGEYKIKVEDELIYVQSYKYIGCCGELIEIDYYEQLYNITKVAYEGGSDLIGYDAYYRMLGALDVDNELYALDWSVEKTANNVDLSPKLFYSKTLDFVVPLNDGAMEKMVEYINEFPLDVTKATVSTQFLTGLTTISYEESIGSLKYTVEIVYDKNGILRSNIVQQYLNDELISESALVRKMGIFDTIFTDYIWFIVIGAVALIAIVVIVMKMKAK